MLFILQRGRALSMIQHLPEVENEAINDKLARYEAIFITRADSMLARSEVQSRCQFDTESIATFHTLLKDLFINAYPARDPNNDADLISLFCRGLRDSTLSLKLLQTQIDTYAEAKDLAEANYAGTVLHAKHRNRNPAIHAFGQFNKRGRGQPRGGIRGPSSNAPCRVCQSPKHWARECPQKNGQQNGQQNRQPGNNQFRGGRNFRRNNRFNPGNTKKISHIEGEDGGDSEGDDEAAEDTLHAIGAASNSKN